MLGGIALFALGLHLSAPAAAADDDEAFRKEIAALEKSQQPRGVTVGLGLGGSLNVIRYGQRSVRGKDSVIGGGGLLSLVLGYFATQHFALLLDSQLSIQRADIGGEGITAIDGLFAAALRGHTAGMHYLHGGLGLAIGHRLDVESPGGQTTGLGLGFTAAAGYQLVRLGFWSLAAELRFSGQIFPGTELSVSILQWALGLGLHRWE